MGLPNVAYRRFIPGSNFYSATLSETDGIKTAQTLVEAGFPLGNQDPGLPVELRGQFDNDIFYLYGLNPETGLSEFQLDSNGDKQPVFIVFTLPNGGVNDGIFAVGNQARSIYALSLTTLRLGGGDDWFQVVDEKYNILQFTSRDVSITSASGYVFQSNIFAGGGNDFVSPLMPWQSVFKGGSNTGYESTVLSDSLTVEELSVGDTLELQGSRNDWDIEFKDGNGDGVVTLSSVLDERDYIALSNNNRVSGFERIKLGNSFFDLVLYDQLDSNVVYGQPEYFLVGTDGDGAPVLNSDIGSGSELWEAFRFNRTKLQGIAGTATDLVDVYTGKDGDTPFLVGVLQFANLNTEAGNDIVEIGSADQASFDLGTGADSANVKGQFSKSVALGGDGADNIIIDTLINSRVDGGLGNDVVEIRLSAASGVFDGAGGAADRIVLPGAASSYGLKYSKDSTGLVTLTDKALNIFAGFEFYTFSDKAYTLADVVTGIDANQFNPSAVVASPPPGGIRLVTADPTKSTSQLLEGGDGADILTGGFAADILRGGLGSDQLSGGPGKDIFELAFGDKSSDLFLDYEPREDSIRIAGVLRKSRLGKFLKGKAKSKSSLTTVKSEDAAARSKAFYAYDRFSGDLFYNSNLSGNGFGSAGGLIAKLSPGLSMKSGELMFDYDETTSL